MFKKPQHEHRSTGIASGLEYREGYAVGGQVTTPKRGLVDGPGGYAGHNKDIPLQNINPNLGTGLGGIDLNKIMEFSKQQQADLFPPIEPIDYTQFERDFSKYKTDYSGLEPSRLGAVGEAAALTIGEPIPEGQDQFATFIANYFSIQKQVYDTCRKFKYFSPFETIIGEYEDPVNGQIPNTYSHYANIAMETLMLKCQPQMEKATGLKLYPAYTYARIYKKGDELKRHKDRLSCEISTTMNLGGDAWPIYLEPSGKKGMKGVKVDSDPGHMLVSSGFELELWRKKSTAYDCVQVFFYYNNSKTPGAEQKMFNKSPHLGLPSWLKK